MVSPSLVFSVTATQCTGLKVRGKKQFFRLGSSSSFGVVDKEDEGVLAVYLRVRSVVARIVHDATRSIASVHLFIPEITFNFSARPDVRTAV